MPKTNPWGNIRTEHVRPPIPTTKFDWCAWWDGTEEDGPYGWGSTEEHAIEELLALELEQPTHEEER